MTATIDATIRQVQQRADCDVVLHIRCRACGWVNRVFLVGGEHNDAEIGRWCSCPKCRETIARERARRPHRR